MEHQLLLALTAIVVLGIAAQLIAWRLGFPSILLLLTFGLLAGPVTGFLRPDELFGDLLLPLVSLAVGVILFEGGMSLRVRELRGEVGGVFLKLMTLGALVTWLACAAAARWVLGFDWPLATLLGAVLVVTGPTVIGPMLRQLRIGGQVGSVLRWEGIVIDPIGAILAVLVFKAIHAGNPQQLTSAALLDLGLTALIGVGLGVVGACVLYVALRRFWVPDPLHNAVSLAAVLAVFTAANLLQREAGLVSVTVMGVALANQRSVTVKHLVEFKENLTILLVSGLFIVLAARLHVEDFAALDWRALAFLAVVVLVVRPAAVSLSALGSNLTWSERLVLCWMAPRGIVAAAVASVFALEMVEAGHPQARLLPPIVFLVILGTVALYGLTVGPLARRCGLAQSDPQGVLFAGAHPWARAIAKALRAEGVAVLLVDLNRNHVAAARLDGLPIYYGSILAEETGEGIDVSCLGQLLAVTPNDEVNALACLRFVEVFGRGGVYQLPFEAPAEGRREAVSLDQRGRLLFSPDATYSNLVKWCGETPTTKTTRLTGEFDYQAFQKEHGDAVLPVFLIRENGQVRPCTVDESRKPQPGHTVISLVRVAAPAPPREAAAVAG